MYNYFYKLFLISFLILSSNFCFALNLGEIQLISKPNQAFLANIDLLDYTRDEIDSLNIRLASDKEYEKFGIENNSLLKKLQFSLEGNKHDRLYIQLHAAYLTKEFSSSVLLDVSWEGGQIIKQYHISQKDINVNNNADDVELLHKQFQAAIDAVLQEDPLSSKDINREIHQQVQRLNINQPQSVPFVDKIRKTTSGGIEYSRVEKGESVSKIAQLLAANKKVSSDQVMVALFNENRDSFLDNNINLLKIGVTLKIENENSFALISKEEASRLAKHYMSARGNQRELESAQIASIVFPEDGTNSTEDKIVAKQLEIVSASEDIIPQDILRRIRAEELAKAEELVRKSKAQLQTLQSEITRLKNRIKSLETMTENQDNKPFLDSDELLTIKNKSSGNSATIQDENFQVLSTGLALDESESDYLSLYLKKHTTTILYSSAFLLFISFVIYRYRAWLSSIIQRFRTRILFYREIRNA